MVSDSFSFGMPSIKKKKEKKKSWYVKELDRVFSLFIRNRDRGICASCGVKKDISEMQCGHYISRSHMSTRWDEENCHCQCVGCNVFKGGNYPAYTVFLQDKYGEGFPKVLYRRGQEIKQLSIKELKEKIEHYVVR